MSGFNNIFTFLAAAEAPAAEWDSGGIIFLKLFAIGVLVFLNGFFVAAEFALVKIRGSQLDALIEEGRRSAGLAKHITDNLEAYLSACQLGITLASLGLGWVGEPFLAQMIQPIFAAFGVPVVRDHPHLLVRARSSRRSLSSTSSLASRARKSSRSASPSPRRFGSVGRCKFST
jgi:hypothetical protein